MRAFLRRSFGSARLASRQLGWVVLIGALAAVVAAGPSVAQKRRAFDGNAPLPDKPDLGSLGAQINANTIAIVSGNINAAWLTLAYDLSAVLDDGNDFRVLPVIGKGGAQNVRDVRYLKGIDLGITVTSVLGKFRRSGELGDVADKIDYITKLSDDDMHVMVRADSSIVARSIKRPKGQFQRHGQRHGSVGRRRVRPARHQACRGQYGAGRRLRENEERRNRRDDSIRQAGAGDRQVAFKRRHSVAASAL